MKYDFLTEVVKFKLDQLAQASQISLGRVFQATNMSNRIKEQFPSPSLPLNPPPKPQLDSGMIYFLVIISCQIVMTDM